MKTVYELLSIYFQLIFHTEIGTFSKISKLINKVQVSLISRNCQAMCLIVLIVKAAVNREIVGD